MRTRLRALAVLAAVALAATACGPDTPAAPNTAGTTPAAASTAASPTAAAGLTPDQVCALVSLADMSRATGKTAVSTKSEWSGPIAVCDYDIDRDNFTSTGVITEYDTNGKAAVDYTKAKGQHIDGLGEDAVWFKTSGQLSVEVGGNAVFHVFIMDVRFNHNDPAGAARQIAEIALPRLPRT